MKKYNLYTLSAITFAMVMSSCNGDAKKAQERLDKAQSY